MDRFLGQLNRKVGARRSVGPSEAVKAPGFPGDKIKSSLGYPLQPSTSTSTSSQSHNSTAEEDLYGLFELWPAELTAFETTVDIVAIHGLNGHPYRTWTKDGHFWLKDFLPSALQNARIFTYGYNSKIAFSGTASRVDDYARVLLERLRARRRDLRDEKKPIIFICHSLGGIVLKKALITAHERSDRYGPISRNTFGVMFMGTPHRGSDTAFWATILGTMADVLTVGSIRTQLLHDLQPKSSCLGDICSQFVERAQSLRIFTIYERLRIKGLPSLVVDKDSAILHIPNEVPIPIEEDHRDMCRFSNEKSEKYQLVLDCLKELMEDAQEKEEPSDTLARSIFINSLKKFVPEMILRRIPRPSPGTCAWITTNDHFKSWRDVSKNKLLWISGVPGVGKTTLMRYVIETQRRWLQRYEAAKENQYVVAFFMCDSKESSRNSYFDLLSSILFQILSQNMELFRYLNDTDIEEYIMRIENEQDLPGEDTVGILWQSLSTILQRSKGVNFWIFVDAIDELSTPSRDSFLSCMGKIIDQDIVNKVKMVFSDRVTSYSRRFKHNCLALELHSGSEAGKDVHSFILAQVEELCTNGAIPWQFQTEIEETFVDLSEGNFLQASLAWKNFHSGVSYWSPQVIKTRLESLRKISKEATAYYCSLLQRIPEDSQEVAKLGFTWVLGSRKPLNVSELQHAVAIGAGQQSWADLVESLGFNFEVQFDQAFGYLLRVEPDRSVRFTHSTVKELLTSTPHDLSASNLEVLSKFQIRESDIDAELAKACIIILSFRDFVRLRNIAQEALTDEIKEFLMRTLRRDNKMDSLDFEKYDDGDRDDASGQLELETHSKELKQRMGQAEIGNDNHSLFSYCVAYWNYHCSQGGSSPEVVDSLSRFTLLRQSHFFHLVAMLLGKAKVHRGLPWSDIDQFARVPPLHFIMRIGDHPAVVENLINQGQNINGIDAHGWTPLTWAALENRWESMEFLLTQDSTVFTLPGCQTSIDSTLHLACKSGASVEVIQRLIDDPRANINAKGRGGWTVLHWCLSKAAMLPIVDNLLSRKELDINNPDSNGCTYLDQAFHDGLFESVLLKLVTRWDMPFNWFKRTLKPNPNNISEDRPEMSFLHTASVLQWHKVEMLILERDPWTAFTPEFDGMNLLERYAFHGIEQGLSDVLAILQTTPNSGNEQGNRLLRLCAQQDWETIVLGLRTKFDVNDSEVDENGRTLAHWACELHWKSISSIIAKKPIVWLNHQANNGKTALHVAVEHRNRLACECLLGAGANYLIRDNHQRLPIHIAAEEGHRSILLLLLEQPFHDYGKDQQGRHLLHLLVMWHSDAFIRQCLVILRGKIDVIDRNRRSPLHYATMFGNSPAVKVLLELGGNPNRKDAFGMTPTHYALSEGSLTCVQLLLQSSADLKILDKFQRNALQLAIRSENSDLIDFIVEILESDPGTVKRNIDHKDAFGQTAMHLISQWNTMKYRPLDQGQDDSILIEVELDDEPSYLLWKASCATVERYIRILKTFGADVNAKDEHKNTPLHVATKTGNDKIVDILLGFPATRTSMADGRGFTPLDWAMVDERTRIADALRRRSAQNSVGWRRRLRPLYNRWVDDWEEGVIFSGEWALAEL